MLAKRIIPCLDVKNGQVVKGVRFKNHEVVGEIVSMARQYCEAGADELVFYDITASPDNRVVAGKWVKEVARVIDIPFCVAGGIDSVESAASILASGADKVSVNSSALSDPLLITRLAESFGSQCVVVGIDSYFHSETGQYRVFQYTGDPERTCETSWNTMEWVKQVQALGAGEIVLNTMNQDGVRNGYDIDQLATIRQECHMPLIASGGAGKPEHFLEVFEKADVEGALAASVFHKDLITIPELKQYLAKRMIEVRPICE